LASGGTVLAMLHEASGGTFPVQLSSVGDAAERTFPHLALESPFGTPSWDVLATEAGFATVWTEPGSAICGLGYRGPTGNEVQLTQRYPAGVFENPRFVRGEPGAAAAITAIAAKHDGGSVLALFSQSLDSGHSAYVPLPALGAGLLADGLLLRNGVGYLLFVKRVPPGPRGAERRDGRGESVIPGILYCARLNAQLEPIGGALRPLGDGAIYEFDADLSGGRVLLFATTADGYVAASAHAGAEALHWSAAQSVVKHADFAAPSVLAAGATPVAAAIAGATTAHPQIVMGSYWAAGPAGK
jgi:hypothetical protein